MDSQGVFYQQPNASDGSAARAARSHAVQPRLRQGQVREHGLDRERQVRRPEGGLHRRLPRAPRRADAATTRTTRAASTPTIISATARVPATRTCRRPASRRAPPGTAPSATSTCSTSSASARRMTGGCARIVGAFYEDNKLFDQTDWRYKTIPACTANGASGTPGNSGCLTNIGTVPGTSVENPGRAERQHVLLPGHPSRRPSRRPSSRRWTST